MPQDPATAPKPLDVVPVPAPPPEHRVARAAAFAAPGDKRTRYSLPSSLDSASPVGFRTRVALDHSEASEFLQLFSLPRPTAFAPPDAVTEQELFEESSLGVLTARQSTNFRGHRQVTFGPRESTELVPLLRQLSGLEAPVLDGATHTHLVLSRPYRTPFTLLLTLVGHKPLASLATVPARLWNKRVNGVDDIPTIGYLQGLHLGILADAMERAAVVASEGRRRAQVFQAPMCGAHRERNRHLLRRLEERCGLTLADRVAGWHLSIVTQVGNARDAEQIPLRPATCRKLGANLVALRSERIQPGVNAEKAAPPQYQSRQPMDVPDELTVQAGRAAYNAFAHWTGCDREESKRLLLLERVDVLTPNGKSRLRAVREHLERVTDRVVKNIPLWADLPTGRSLSRNAERGRKAFALAGQRIYFGGLSRPEIEKAGLDWELAVRAFGAGASRSALYAEIMGVVDLPEGCDLLAGCCLMAGPVNQNDIGKTFFGDADLLEEAYPNRSPTSLLVWTLKAKTVADPIGNEEQLLNASRKGALVDLRPGPHEIVRIAHGMGLSPMRRREGRVNTERAFSDAGNFVVSPDGRAIPGNRGSEWPAAWRSEYVWPEASPNGAKAVTDVHRAA
jgi:hypothetical protein